MKRELILVILPWLLLAGCMVGPKYVKPTVPLPQPDAFKEYKKLDGWKTAQPMTRPFGETGGKSLPILSSIHSSSKWQLPTRT
jgi:hypothetical protein